MLRYPLLLSLGILSLALGVAVAPMSVLVAVLIASLVALTWHRPVWGVVLALLSSIPAEFARVSIGGLSVLPLDVVAPVVLLVWLTGKLLRRESILLDWAGGSLVIFWSAALVSLIFGAAVLDPAQLTTAGLQLVRLIGISGLFFVARDFISKERTLTTHSLTLVGLGLALSGFVLLAFIPDFAAAGLTAAGWDPHIGRLTGPWLDPNFAGGAFAFILAFLGAQFLNTRDVARQVVLLGTAGVLFVALLLTVSRSGLLAFAVGGLVLGLVRSRALLAGGVGVLALAAIAIPRLGERLGELVTTLMSFGSASQQVMDPTAALRVASWAEGWRIFTEYPVFGVGYGAYAVHQTFVPVTSHAASASDSSLLTVAATTGVVGLVVFVSFFAAVVTTVWRQRADALALGFLAGFAGLFMHAIIVNSLLFAPIMLYVFVTAGMVCGSVRD